MKTITAGNCEIALEGADSTFDVSFSTVCLAEGIDLLHLKFVAPMAVEAPEVKLAWRFPIVDVHAIWHPAITFWNPATDRQKDLPPNWSAGATAKATSGMPVCCLYSLSGGNRLTFAFSDALNATRVQAGVLSREAVVYCAITLFTEPLPPIKEYEATLRLDTRAIPYYESLEGVQQWWAALPGYQPAPVPESARQPLYSTWYSFHQRLTADEVERQCQMAQALGCEAVIVDDGWQTSTDGRGYAYCGDWEVSKEKFPDMREHVARVHALGLKYLLWYSVPFIGKYSKAWSRFSDRFLDVIEQLNAGVLDPRFPDIREYLINIYEQAAREWDLDGFKLDFVDSFNLSEKKRHEYGNGRDYRSVAEAVDRLLTDVISRLRRIKPDIMIEFRQSYVGPLMRKYGNMFRAMDCPNDAITNRIRTLDIRLLCGNTAAHSDMLMWNERDPVESAALQIINILFSVPQISVLLDRISAQHLEMVRFWLSFWRQHRDMLLDGKLMPLHPEMLYPLVIATTAMKRVVAMYSDAPINPGRQVPDELFLVNGTLKRRVLVELDEDLGARRLQVRNCCGEIVQEEAVDFARGSHRLEIPAAGIATVSKAQP